MLKLFYISKFKKDFKRVTKRGLKKQKLEAIIKLLLLGEDLPIKCRNHELSGNYSKHMECHIEPDWLLIYRITNDELRLERTGSHSDFF